VVFDELVVADEYELEFKEGALEGEWLFVFDGCLDSNEFGEAVGHVELQGVANEHDAVEFEIGKCVAEGVFGE